MAIAVTRGIANSEAVSQIMLNGDGTGIDAALLEIAPRQPIEIASINIHRFVRIVLAAIATLGIGNARIRGIVTFQVIMADGHSGRRAKTEGERRRYAPATDIDFIAARDIGIVLEKIQPECRIAIEEFLVEVQGVAASLVRTIGEAAIDEVPSLGLLADEIEAAAGRAPVLRMPS